MDPAPYSTEQIAQLMLHTIPDEVERLALSVIAQNARSHEEYVEFLDALGLTASLVPA